MSDKDYDKLFGCFMYICIYVFIFFIILAMIIIIACAISKNI